MNAAARIGILGGTFDPFHLGHLDTAVAARAALDLDRVFVVPSRVPPHRPARPLASAWHRFAMAAIAVNGLDGLAASDLELGAPAPSYTADTLTRFRESAGLRAAQIFFITGADAFAEIETWHRYPDVLDLSHFVVISRPGCPADSLTRRLPGLAARMRSPGSREDNPSSAPAIFLVDAATRDVSSTDIRRRLQAGLPIAGMVSTPVETHIRQHQLYVQASIFSTADHLHGQD